MAKNSFVSWLDGASWLIKLVFCIPLLNIVWAVYRIIKGATENNILLLIIGILWIVPGAAICWIWDLVTTLIYKRPLLS